MQQKLPETGIIVVADSFDYDANTLSWADRRIDRPHSMYIQEMLDAFRERFSRVVWYENPNDFVRNLPMHSDDVVVPYWFGQDSRNRHALVPAICEAAGIRYIGGDVYTKTISNDKALSKALCRQAGLRVADGLVVFDEHDLLALRDLNYPCVAKPIFEGTSLGISQNNIVEDVSSAQLLAISLLKEFKQPVIVEEFLSGREVSICLLGYGDYVRMWHAAERYVMGDDDYFLKNLYSFSEKKSDAFDLRLRSVKSEIPEAVYTACHRLFTWLDKVEYIRIDGKLSAKGFAVIELTPETHLGANAEFCGTMAFEGVNYPDLLATMIENSLERYRSLDAS